MRTFAKFLTAVAGALAIFGLNMAWTDWNNLSAVSDKPETYYSSKELGWFDSVSALQIENFPHHYVVRFRMTLRAGSFTTTEEGLYSSEAVFKKLTAEPKAPESLFDLFDDLIGDGMVGYCVSTSLDPLPDGSFKFEDGKIIAGTDDSETGLVIFQLHNEQGLALLGKEGTRPDPVAREGDIQTDGHYAGHVLIFAFNKGDTVFLADPDQKLVFHCVWNGDQIDITTYTEKEFGVFASLAPKDTVPALPSSATSEG